MPHGSYSRIFCTTLRKYHEAVVIFHTVGGGGGAQPHTISFGGVFPNITAKDSELTPSKYSLVTKIDEVPLERISSSKVVIYCFANCRLGQTNPYHITFTI